MFISRLGHLVSTQAPEAWLSEAEQLAGQDDEEALALLQKALAWYQTSSAEALEEGKAACLLGEGICLARIAQLRAAREQWQEAGRFFREARGAFRNVRVLEEEADVVGEYHGAENEAITLRNLALAHSHLGEHRQALEAAGAARDLYRSLEDPQGESKALQLGGYACADLGCREEAVEKLKTAARLARRAGDQELAARLRADLARVRCGK